MPNKQALTPLFKACRSIVAKEMRSYDLLSTPSRIRYERAIAAAPESLYPLRSCAHGRALHTPCVDCQRTDEDCIAYMNVAVSRIKELLALLA